MTNLLSYATMSSMKEQTPDAAWATFLPELKAVTVDVWSDDDYEEEPGFKTIADDVTAGRITKAVLDEIENCLSRDWCRGHLRTAALTVLAANGHMEEFSEAVTHSRRPRTMRLLGKRWIV